MAANSVALTVPPRVLRRGITYLLFGAVLLTLFSVAATGANLSGLLLALNFDNQQIGFAMSLTLFCLPVQAFGAIIQQRYFQRKKFIIGVTAAQYGLYLLIAALVAWRFAPTADGAAAPGIFSGAGWFFLLFLLGQIALQLTGSVFLAYLGDFIPARESNAFWTRRQSWTLVASLVGGIAFGLLADALGRTERSTFAVILALGCVCGLAALRFNTYPPDPAPSAPAAPPALWELIKSIWREPSYRVLVYFFGVWNFANWLTCAFNFVYLQREMDLSLTKIQMLTALSALVGFISGYLFRILGNKYGRKPILFLCTALKVVEFIFWGLMIPRYGFIAAVPSFILGGFVNNGATAAQLSLLTSTGNRRDRSFSIALFYGLTGMASAIMSVISGYIYAYLCQQEWAAHLPFGMTPFNLLAFVSAAGFAASLLLLPKLHENGAAPTAQVIRVLLTHNPFRAVYYAHVLAQPLTEKGRVETLAVARGSLIATELLRDLASPSRNVRFGAVENIINYAGELPAEIFGTLTQLLDEVEIGLQVPAARALGKHRRAAAREALAAHAQNADGAVAQTCLWALGELPADAATATLLRQILRTPKQRSLWNTAAEGLGKIGAVRDWQIIWNACVNDEVLAVQRRYLLALARLFTREREKVYPLFDREDKTSGAGCEIMLREVAGGEIFTAARTATEREQNATALALILAPRIREQQWGLNTRPAPAATGAALATDNGDDDAAEAEAEWRDWFVNGELRANLWQSSGAALDGERREMGLALALSIWARLKYAENAEANFLLLTALFALAPE